jgi:hypothetical protein
MNRRILLIVGGLVLGLLIFAGYRHFSTFPLVVMLEADEAFSPGAIVFLDDQPVGRVRGPGSAPRSLELVIENREVFPRLLQGIVRVTGEELHLSSALVKPQAPRLARGALVPSMSPAVLFAKRYLDPARIPAWAWIGAAVLGLGVLFRRPLRRLAA